MVYENTQIKVENWFLEKTSNEHCWKKKLYPVKIEISPVHILLNKSLAPYLVNMKIFRQILRTNNLKLTEMIQKYKAGQFKV